MTAASIQTMGVGGLLAKALRPQPRSTSLSEPKGGGDRAGRWTVAAHGRKEQALAAGRPDDGSGAGALRAARPAVSAIVVVTGHEAAQVQALVDSLRAELGEAIPLRCVHNPDYAAGLSTSLRVGIAALSAGAAAGGGAGGCDGALVCLGDMPRVGPAHIEALLAAFDPSDGRGGDRADLQRSARQPVLWSSRYFPELQQLQGDSGARSLLDRHADVLCYVPMPDDGVTIDVDTPEALKRVQDQG